jgi:predicted nucleic acid-binding protein
MTPRISMPPEVLAKPGSVAAVGDRRYRGFTRASLPSRIRNNTMYSTRNVNNNTLLFNVLAKLSRRPPAAVDEGHMPQSQTSSSTGKSHDWLERVSELLAGFKGGNRERANKEQLMAFAATERVHTAPITTETPEFYARVIHQLRAKGTPIPTNDIWIAALTMEHGASLATSEAHFSKIDGLKLYDG